MLVALSAILLAPVAAPQTRTTAILTTKRRTVSYRDPAARVTVNAGDRVRIVLTNPDARAWTALRPITRSVVLLAPSNSSGPTSTFEYATSAAARSTLEFRHPSGATREVKLTVAARTPERTTSARTTTAKIPPAKPPVSKLAATVTEAQGDATVTVRRGEAFELRLSANATTGYSWRLEPLPGDLLSLKSSRYIPTPAAPMTTGPVTTGSGGTQVYRFVAAGTGTGDIDLVYERPFARGQDVKRFHFTLRVL